MGITKGEGKRTIFGVGQFLTGIYDENQDKFMTLTKIGTGLTDEQFREFAKKAEKLKVKDMPKNYEVDKLLNPDIWIKPGLVVEISGDIITRSSVHTAGRVMQKTKTGGALEVQETGYALRFPRLERFRNDKSPQDVTTLQEIKQMFAKQGV
jgi:DNA ligase-1